MQRIEQFRPALVSRLKQWKRRKRPRLAARGRGWRPWGRVARGGASAESGLELPLWLRDRVRGLMQRPLATLRRWHWEGGIGMSHRVCIRQLAYRGPNHTWAGSVWLAEHPA